MPLDNAGPAQEPARMSDSRYRIPVEELVASAQVQAADQVEEQTFPVPGPGDPSPGVLPYGDGMAGDADGD